MYQTDQISFGLLLKQLRKRAGMTQRDLAAALNYSDSYISSLEKAQRQPDVDAVITSFIPALGLQDDPVTATFLMERAAAARGERVSMPVTQQQRIPKPTNEPWGHLPLPPTELIGRTQQVNLLCNRLLGHSGRLLTLIGPPGIGKTRLALAVAARLQPHYADGAFFVPLAEVSEVVAMAATLNGTLGIQDASPKLPKRKLIEHLRSKTMLLVLDNCEQIRDAAVLVTEIIATCAGVHILATSRERLHLRAEQRFRVPPLELESAVALFTQRAAAVVDDFGLTAANRPTIEAICQSLDGLPLALELCAAQIDMLPLPQLLKQLQNRRLDLLVNGTHDLPPRHRTLRQAIQSSYRLLSGEESRLFRRLSVFAGGFTLSALELMAEWWEEREKQGESVRTEVAYQSILHALIGKSLVRAEIMPSDESRYFLLESIREFALEKLRLHNEEDLSRQCHFATYLQLFRTTDYQLRGPEATAWFALLTPEYDNLRAAFQWAFGKAHYEEAAWLVIAASWFCRVRGQWYEQIQWHQQLLPYREQLSPNLRLIFLINFYSIARALEEFQSIQQYTTEIMQLLECDTDKRLHASAWHFIAITSPNAAEAVSAWEKALMLARKAGKLPDLGQEFCIANDHLFVLGAACENYALRMLDQGEFARAIGLIEESVNAFKARGFQSGVVAGLALQGRLALLQGDVTKAHMILQEATMMAIASNHPTVIVKIQPLFALTTLYHDNATEARQLLLESLKRSTELKDKVFLSQICIYLAETALWEGEANQAIQWLAQYRGYHVEPRWLGMALVNCLLVAAQLAAAQQHYHQAALLFGFAEAMRVQSHYTLAVPVHARLEPALAIVRSALSDALFTETFRAGQCLSLNEGFAMISVLTDDSGLRTLL